MEKFANNNSDNPKDEGFSINREMIADFAREAQRHLISARNALLVLETLPNNKEALENIFKTFHTIKGLADFLNLKDIYRLTASGEQVLDKFRKDILPFDENAMFLTKKSISALQELLEILDEQVTHPEQAVSEMKINLDDLITSFQNYSEKSPATQEVKKKSDEISPIAKNNEFNSILQKQVADQIKSAEGELTVKAEMIQNLLRDFTDTSNELKLAQSKLQERQKELIRERELAIKLTQRAQAEARAKSEYLANMAHEIRTLINAIMGFAEVLKTSAINEKEESHINTIITSGHLLLEIVNHILDFSKIEAGKLKLEEISFNLDFLIEEVFKIIRPRLRGKPITLFFDISDNVSRNLIGDPTRIKQIIINLIDNGIKFTEDGEIGMRVDVNPEKDSKDACELQFGITDSGIGITEDRKKLIFDSFTQADESTSRIYGGTGLGLAICRNYIESMGGKINVESELGKGTKFNFTLTLKKRSGSKTSLKSSSLARFNNTEVMIVEHHAIIANSLVNIFQKNDFKVFPVAKNAKQAYELLIERSGTPEFLPKIIFIETILPNKEGFFLAYKIKQHEQFRNIKLVALTSDLLLDKTQDYQDAKFDHFLPKPILKAELTEAILDLLAPQERADRSKAPETDANAVCKGLNILVVEDSVPNQELLKVLFENLGCQCSYAGNGQEALECFRSQKFDICFMDLQMPIMSGVEATKIIRKEINQTTPIIALTAAEIQAEKERCLEVGMNDYLAKPFGVEELKEKIVTNLKR